ncbi:unnamed protein product [Adineta steineri]|uniref:Uncharacterized protein n=1 Tax=Adineta steineri TaxID=433720 RepID=A0A820Q2W8_9BILA|nr:unnamed protein product [Adineta steineri]
MLTFYADLSSDDTHLVRSCSLSNRFLSQNLRQSTELIPEDVSTIDDINQLDEFYDNNIPLTTQPITCVYNNRMRN